MCMFGWGAEMPDPDNFLYGLLQRIWPRPPGAANVACGRTPEYTEICLKAQKDLRQGRTKSF